MIDQSSVVSDVVDRLRASATFESGARALLGAMLETVAAAVASSVHRQGGRLLRGVLHLRPEGGYRGLVVLPAPGTPAELAEAPEAILPSATVWRFVEEHGEAAAVDVATGMVELAGVEAAVAPWVPAARGDEGESEGTVYRLLGRDATHLYAVPLRGHGPAVQGMVSLEANCKAAIAAPFVWSECAPLLQLLADVATPMLLALPRATPEHDGEEDPLLPVVGRSMASVVQTLRTFAAMDETVLVTGPTGAGKSRLARWCHERSRRRTGPFETVDLLTIPDDMQMAELFGWRRGAFTGAVRDQDGFVSRAEGGTLFLDEVDKLSLKAQAGLLALLETRRYRALGDGVDRAADLRFVVGTNADLRAAIEEGSFREDLFYRINVLPVRLPPLAERRDEIRGWARFMVERHRAETGLAREATLAPDAEGLLERHSWPGNLRQLDNVTRRAAAMALSEHGDHGGALSITARHVEGALGLESRPEPSGPALPLSLTGALVDAAEAFVSLAVDRRDRGEVVELAHCDAFRGAVLEVARTRLGDVKEVYRLFGRDAVVERRNHSRDFRRETKKLEALRKLVS